MGTRRSTATRTRQRPRWLRPGFLLFTIALGYFLILLCQDLLQLRDRATQQATLRAQITRTKETIAHLQLEKKRLHDVGYLEAQAREDLGYHHPGEVVYYGVYPEASQTAIP